MKRLEGRVAVITGSASGIGFAIADRLAKEGSRLVMTDIDAAALATASAQVRASGAEVETVQLDVRDPAGVERVAAFTVERFGALHVAVNNAGIVNRGLVWELSTEDWQRVLDINLWGVVHGCRYFVQRILETAEEGHVVNVASMAAVLPQDRLGPYTVAKHGVLGLSDVLRADLAAVDAPVGVSVVMPGRIRTAMNPIGTVDPATVADNVVDAMRNGRPYVFTDHHSAEDVRRRLEAILAARADVIGNR